MIEVGGGKGTVRKYKGSKTMKDYLAWDSGQHFPNTIQKFTRDKQKFHPTQKPLSLLEWIIKTYSHEGGLVVDPTMGVGSCGVAALNSERKFIGVELDPQYFSIAVDRLTKRGDDGSI